MTIVFLTTVFVVRSFAECDCVPIVGKQELCHDWDESFCSVLMLFSAMTSVVTPAPKPAAKGKHVQLFKMRCIHSS